MTPPDPGTHWVIGDTLVVVDRYAPKWDSVHCITEDGHARVYPLAFFAENTRPATWARLGCNPNPEKEIDR